MALAGYDASTLALVTEGPMPKIHLLRSDESQAMQDLSFPVPGQSTPAYARTTGGHSRNEVPAWSISDSLLTKIAPK